MSDLSVANAIAQLTAVVAFFAETRDFGSANTPSWESLENTLRGTSAGNFRAPVLAAIGDARARLATVLAARTAAIDAALYDCMDAINKPAGGQIADRARRLRDYMHANSLTFAAREYTFGSPSYGGGNAGNGALYRVTVDEDGYERSGATAEAKVLTCDLDQKSGAQRFRERFRLLGVEAARDALSTKGSGLDLLVRALDERDSEAYLANAGFDTGTAATLTATDSLSGWTLSSVSGSPALSSSSPYRTPFGVTTGLWFQFGGNHYLEQEFTRQALPVDAPILLAFAVNRLSSADGTLTVALVNSSGSATTSRAITVSGLSSGWNLVTLPATPGSSSYYKAWATDRMRLRFTLASNTTGTVGLDSIVLSPMAAIDGTHLAIVAGSTPWKVGDTISLTDSGGTSGVMARELREATGVDFPVTAGSEYFLDPS